MSSPCGVLINFLVDMTYAVLDPRNRYEDGSLAVLVTQRNWKKRAPTSAGG